MNTNHHQLGILQGRLTPGTGVAYRFPAENWQQELTTAAKLGFHMFEWVIDHQTANSNPLFLANGRKEINGLLKQTGLKIPVTYIDYLREVPLASEDISSQKEAEEFLSELIEVGAEVGIRQFLVPLTGNASIQRPKEEDELIRALRPVLPRLNEGSRLLFKTDLGPGRAAGFINRLPRSCELVYDTGNSMYLGFNIAQEIHFYGDRIAIIHMTDHDNHSNAVQAGQGLVDFDAAFRLLGEVGYKNHFVLETIGNRGSEDALVAKQFAVSLIQRHL